MLDFLKNLMIREGAGKTENQDLKVRKRGTKRFISLEQADGYPLVRPQYFFVCQNTVRLNYGHNLHLILI